MNTQDKATGTKADTQRKDSCNYAVEMAKQFITLASAGIAFVVGLAVTAPGKLSPCQSVWILLLLGASIVFGLLFVMSVVGHINREGNYDVYTPLVRILSGLQVLFFLIAGILLGIAAIGLTAAG